MPIAFLAASVATFTTILVKYITRMRSNLADKFLEASNRKLCARCVGVLGIKARPQPLTIELSRMWRKNR